MKVILVPAMLIFVAALSPCASAVTATFPVSNQVVTLTGLGGTGGVGQSRVTWGSCAYDGTNTKCTLSATYTGVGGGGTLTALLTYKGNGASPLNAVSISPGNDQIFFTLSSGTFVVSLTESTGATITFLSQQLFSTLIARCARGLRHAAWAWLD